MNHERARDRCSILIADAPITATSRRVAAAVPGAGPRPLSTRMSILPTRLVDSPNSHAAPSAARRSQPIPIAYAAATSSARSLERLVTTTLAPSSHSVRAVARPNPCIDADRHRRGQALRTVPTRSFAEHCVESHTWPPALSYRTPRFDTKLQAERSGHWTTTACAPLAC